MIYLEFVLIIFMFFGFWPVTCCCHYVWHILSHFYFKHFFCSHSFTFFSYSALIKHLSDPLNCLNSFDIDFICPDFICFHNFIRFLSMSKSSPVSWWTPGRFFKTFLKCLGLLGSPFFSWFFFCFFLVPCTINQGHFQVIIWWFQDFLAAVWQASLLSLDRPLLAVGMPCNF